VPYFSNLITIRKGEPALNPLTETVEPAAQELIKLAGKGANWECLFYDPAATACAIHAERPLECRLLKCWDTEEIKKIIGTNCLGRLDIIDGNDPRREHILIHEEKCAYSEINALLQQLPDPARHDAALTALRAIMEQDLQIRGQAIALFHLTLQQELFYFGRPLFTTIRLP
jgi:Fe-S-cluster containining protein